MALTAPGAGLQILWDTAVVPLCAVAWTAIQCAQSSWEISPATTITGLILAAVGLWTIMRFLVGALVCAFGLIGIELTLVKIPIQVQYNPNGCNVFEVFVVPTSGSKRLHSTSNCAILENDKVAAAQCYKPCKVCNKRFWPKVQ